MSDGQPSLFPRQPSPSPDLGAQLFEPPPAGEGWWTGLLAAFDLETTSPDPWEARIVTAALLVEAPNGRVIQRVQLVADPGVPIPADAAQVHGVTDALATAYGRPAREVVATVAAALATWWAPPALPVVIYKADYDWTVLTAECERYGLARPSLGPILDPLVIDRELDRYRKGKRTLADLTAHYGITLERAHTATADARAALALARQLGVRYPKLRRDLDTLMLSQARWQRTWREHINSYWAKEGKPQRVPPGWPLVGRL